MSVSSPVSEHDILAALVVSCSVLAVASLVVWTGCFIVRVRRLQRAARNAAATEVLTRRVLDTISGYRQTDAWWRQLAEWERTLLLQILLGLINQTKGRDQSSLIKLLRTAGFIIRAREAIVDGSDRDRQIACGVLEVDDDETSLPFLQKALGDRDVAVRITAAQALLRRDKIPSLRALLDSLELSADDPPLILSEIFMDLPASLLEEAVALVSSELPPEWRRMLAIALGRRQVLGAFEPIARLLRSPAARLRAAAWVALRELGDLRAGEMVEEGLADPSADVREAACACAGATAGAELAPRLAALLDDPSWDVRYAAAAALWAVGDAGRSLLRQSCRGAERAHAGWQLLQEKEPEAAHGS